MAHSHSPSPNSKETTLLWAAALTGTFMLVEVVGGIMSNSLALLADAGHMLTDFSALLLAWFAARIARKPADTFRSYGYHRMQILAAFFNGIVFILVVIWITVEAVQRLMEPSPVLGGTMLMVAILGLVVNIVVFFILHKTGNNDDLNVQGAIIHVLGDLLGSVAAIAAAVIIMWTGWTPIDPILSVFVALLVLFSAWKLVQRSAHILLEGAPDDVDVKQLRRCLCEQIPEVLDVHHVHVWSLTPERPLLTSHIRVDPSANYSDVLAKVKAVLAKEFFIRHSTIQIECESCKES
ncbi:MAG: cation diffusion facilitator family transporter [Thiohalomonadales bacterium]